MKKRNRKAITIVMSSILAASTALALAGCGGSEIVPAKADPERTFNYWVSALEGTGAGGMYDTYAQNPGVSYMTGKDWTYRPAAQNADGSYTMEQETVTHNIAFNFEAPMAGASPQQSFLTSLNGGTMDVLDLSYSPDTVTSLYEQGALMDITYWVENYMPNYLAYLEEMGMGTLATSEVDGERKYLQLYYFTETAYDWQGYQYRRDWLLEYGKTFDPETGAIGTQTFKEANPSWGWQNYGTAEAEWTDGIIFPSYYGLRYESDGAGLGMGTLTFDGELYDYIRGIYTEKANSAKVLFEEYEGQWPATISDWEWMLDIFQIAVSDLGDPETYGMTLYSGGFIYSGNFVSSFGGGGVEWYKTLEGEDRDGDGKGGDVMFGAEEKGLEEYMAVMRQWYQNGWIDGGFEGNAGDLFWALDDESVRQGKVGIYIAMDNQLMGNMDISLGDEGDLTYGLCSYGMPLPINDKYGDDSLKYKDPYCFYTQTQETGSYMISTAAAGKDLPALFTFLDYLYTEEAARIKAGGLSREQLEECQEGVRELYAEYGLENGAWEIGEDGVARQTVEWQALPSNVSGMLKPVRLLGREGFVEPSVTTKADLFKYQLWRQYSNDGFITKSFYSQLSASQYRSFQSAQTQMRNSFQGNVPDFILEGTGELDRAAFRSYITSLKNEIGAARLTTVLDALAHELDTVR